MKVMNQQMMSPSGKGLRRLLLHCFVITKEKKISMGKHCPKDLKINAVLFQNNYLPFRTLVQKIWLFIPVLIRPYHLTYRGKLRRGKVWDEEFRQQAKIC